ncbi:hypothetical protein [Actinomarinicola tropica]|uniref:WXG100 family type VII secretion target n=1 Tax=Actinomarinicola tropica TaxID=2789776 RepID=A0A5Q2RR73_9ACTN|nr:hypothetical protein [Actinomarinicola tropica]QGG96647.1 hypothetical protein GH723_16945 [Actinomarinicola tropica]
MTDVVEVVEGRTTYRIVGLRTRGEELSALARSLRSQVELRMAAVTSAAADLEGPFTALFVEQCQRVLDAVAELADTVALAASTCAHHPGAGAASPTGAPPRLPVPTTSATLAADPPALRGFVASCDGLDAAVSSVGLRVSLDGVTATSSTTSFTPMNGVPTEVPGPELPLDVRTLVRLPDVSGLTARVLALSSGAKELASLTATAVERADVFVWGSLAMIALRAHAFDLRQNAGVDPRTYESLLRDFWLARGLLRAGIDPASWNPEDGALANRANIEAVYAYYGDLFLQNPEFQWAGMANMIGPSFAAGFFDLELMGTLSDHIGGPPGLPPLHLPGFGPWGEGTPLEALGDLTDEELAFYETTFLQMQKDIFVDASVMHEAYLDGGLSAIRELRAAGILDRQAVQAWEDIASGDPDRIAAGNTALLLREQSQTIRQAYDDMYSRFPSGPAVTYGMTLVGAPSIPGAKGYPDVFPLEVEVASTPDFVGIDPRIGIPGGPGIDLPGPRIGVEVPHAQTVITTPLPDGNIANFDDRWALIERDTLPAYQRLLEEDPARARAIIATPVGERIEDQRLVHQIDDIAHHLATDWDVRVELDR